MKKIVLSTLILAFTCGNLFAQDGGSDKKFKFGLRVQPSVNWYSPVEKKKFESDGSKAKFGFGLVTDFRISDNIWFSTGVSIGAGGGVIKYSESAADSIAYILSDNEIVEPNFDKSLSDQIDSDGDLIRLDKREYKAQYVTIPFTLKMKTNEVGYFTYLGQFGLDVSVKTKGRADDEGVNLSSTNSPNLEDLNIDSELQPLLVGLNVGGGMEYNISGSTALFATVNFHYGFLNTVKNKSQHLINMSEINPDNEKPVQYTPQKFKPFALSLSVGVLF